MRSDWCTLLAGAGHECRGSSVGQIWNVNHAAHSYVYLCKKGKKGTQSVHKQNDNAGVEIRVEFVAG